MEFGAGEEPFHPAVMGREEVEVGGAGMGRGWGALGEVPPDAGEYAADGVGDDVQGVAGGVHDVGADAFKEDGPADEVAGDFERGWPGVAGSQVEEVVDEKERREGAGDEQGVVEPIMKKGDVGVGLDEPAVGGVEGATGEEEGVEEVGEPLHSSARMTRPNPRPSVILRARIMEQVFQLMAPGTGPGAFSNLHGNRVGERLRREGRGGQ